MACQRVGCIQARAVLDQPRAAHGEHRLGREGLDLQARIVAGAVADRGVDVVGRELAQPLARVETDLRALRMLAESLQSRHQPLAGERRRDADRQRALLLFLAQGREGPRERIQAGGDVGHRTRSRRGQRQAAGLAPEQPHAEVVLQRLQLVADRRRRHAELVSRPRETALTRGRLERSQCVHRRPLPFS